MKKALPSILIAIFCLLATFQGASAQPYAYVCNVTADTVTAVDLKTNTAIATVAVGIEPYYVAVTPDGTRAYVTNRTSNTVSVIDTATNTVVATIPVGILPWEIAVTPDGARVCVVNYGHSNPGSVSVISTATNTVIATIPVSQWPRGIAITPDGTRAYISCQTYSCVSVIDIVSNTWLKDISLYPNWWPSAIGISPDGSLIYVGNVVSHTISVVNTASDTVVATIPLSVCPVDIEFKSNATQAYVSSSYSGEIAIVDVATGTEVGKIQVCTGSGQSVAGIARGIEGDRVYVAGITCGIVGVIDTTSNTVVASIPAGPWPLGIAVVPPQNRPPVADDQNVEADAGVAMDIELTASDEDGDTLTYTVVDPPLHGTLTGEAPNVTYTSECTYFGLDSFTFKANDGTVESNMAAVSITVKKAFAFVGFDPPIDNIPVVNSAKAGSTVPVKWRITDKCGAPISDPASFESLTSYRTNCTSLSGDPVDPLETYTGASGLQYLGDGYWQFNWKTQKDYAGQCRIMVLTLEDGSTQSAYFSFK